MTRIAIISDIHGNLEVLKTTINDIKNRNINKIYCLGDIIGKGIHSHECLKIIKDNCDIVIRGNWEDFIIKNKISNDLEMKRYNTLIN